MSFSPQVCDRLQDCLLRHIKAQAQAMLHCMSNWKALSRHICVWACVQAFWMMRVAAMQFKAVLLLFAGGGARRAEF